MPWSKVLAARGGANLLHPAILPALGWNSWNAFYCDITEDKIMTAAKQVVSLGLKDAGYNYINVDDCWAVKDGRDKVTGKIIPDPVKFPTGIRGLADKIHGLGLKVGIYSSAGTKTCAGYPASLDKEGLDAATFASWGIDYLKYDNCYVPDNWQDPYDFCVPDDYRAYGPYHNGTCGQSARTPPSGYNWTTSLEYKRYKQMSDALLAQNRTILYSLCNWGHAAVEEWGHQLGSSWRMTGDISPQWWRVSEILNQMSFKSAYADFWEHNDADMLHIGNGNLTMEESRSHFAFWAAIKSPLIIGTALDRLAAEKVAILKNAHLLAFHQDNEFGKPAQPYKWGVNADWTFDADRPAEYWSGESKNGFLVLALNTLQQKSQRTIVFQEVPGLVKGQKAEVPAFEGRSVPPRHNNGVRCSGGETAASP
ncbi:putative alpha-galactosidase B [Glarea lozoyensis 74030]|uniref:Alpha-galactosidase n=1 Tax=Glarea lozoyensis (strain ATCC 74030 / MF5533) TaxID=1104152 RepID=H0EUT3_GLAL7|nr:putative alpha-galactosidase B [Glarea lozoyensis 74030]